MADSLNDLSCALQRFAEDRDWGQFHTPKNLVMALVAEVGELVEHFQWLTPAQSAEVMTDQDRAKRVSDELADVFIYLVRLADTLGVDLLAATARKMTENAARYPPERARGSAEKAPPLGGPA